MPSLQLTALLDQIAAGHDDFGRLTLPERRRQMEIYHPPVCAPGVTMTPVRELPGSLLLTPAGSQEDGPAVFYVHGGGFTTGSPEIAVTPASILAQRTGLRVFVPRYRLAPEHQYPAQLEDLEAAWTTLAGREDAGKLAVFGESAGGNLTLSLLHRLGRQERERVSAVALSSPVLDLTFGSASMTSNAERDYLFSPASFTEMRELYAPGEDYLSPGLSPLFGDLTGYPPILVLCAAGEMLRDDSVRLAERAAAADVSVDLQVRPSMPHCWPVFATAFPEAIEGLELIAGFLRGALVP